MMSTSKQGSPLPWSYSSLSAYETCPKRFYLTRITKQVKEPQTAATLHGNEVHKALERYVGGSAGLPEKYDAYRPLADKIRMSPGKKLLEYKFGLTKRLTPTEFFGKDVWVRGVLDVGIVQGDKAIVLDYKTGKRKLDGDQLRLFAGVAMSLWPSAKQVKTGYIWLQSDEMDTEVFTPDQKPAIFQDFAARVHRLESSEKNDDWPARPSGLCKNWCPVGKALCDHCGA
jgi:CRISPR/Cas system-associated exonuclease Cas4 (RecB family)